MKNCKYKISSAVCSPLQVSVNAAVEQARKGVLFHNVFDTFNHVYDIVMQINDNVELSVDLLIND